MQHFQEKREVNFHNFDVLLTQIAIILNLYSTKNQSSSKEFLAVKYLPEKGIIQTRKFYSLANHTPTK